MHTQMYMFQTRKVLQFLKIVKERKIAYLILTGNAILLTRPQTQKQKMQAEYMLSRQISLLREKENGAESSNGQAQTCLEFSANHSRPPHVA